MSLTKKHERFIILTIGLTMFIELLDGTILQTALPQIAYSLHINPLNLKAALTIYLLAVGAFIPASGWFADRFGSKPVLLCSVSGFIISSFLCGLSNGLVTLVIFRAIQGIFGAFMVPVVRLLTVQFFKPRLEDVMTKIVPVFLLAPLVGPVLGGFTTTYLNWRFIFFINIPIGCLILLSITCFFPSIQTGKHLPFDVTGFILLSLSLITLLFTVDTITVTSINLLWKLVVAASCFLLFVVYYLYTKKLSFKCKSFKESLKKPVISLAIFKNPAYRYLSLLLAGYQIFAMNMGFITILYVQTRLGYTAMESGLIIVPIILGVLSIRLFLPYLQKRYSVRQRVNIACNSTIINQLLFSIILLHFYLPACIVLLFISGACNGLTISTIQQNIYKTLNSQQITPGSVVNSAIKQLSQSFTIAIVSMVLLISSPIHQLKWNTVLPKTSYATAVWLSALCMIAGFILLRKLQKQAIE